MRASSSGSNPDFIAIRSTMRDLDGPVGRHIDGVSRAVLAEAQRTVPVRSGVLLASLRRSSGRTPGGMFWDVTVGVRGQTPYLSYVLFGTKPHIIRARRRKALRFIGGTGGVVFARQVHHPGQAANNFMVRALRKAT